MSLDISAVSRPFSHGMTSAVIDTSRSSLSASSAAETLPFPLRRRGFEVASLRREDFGEFARPTDDFGSCELATGQTTCWSQD
jgi:hypothetical protein